MLKSLFFILGLGLPLHGALTVLGPSGLRWWKEGVLVIMAVMLLWQFWQNRVSILENIRNLKTKNQNSKNLDFKIWILSLPTVWALFFLAWLEILVWLKWDWVVALTAARYLGLGFGVFLLVWLWRVVQPAKVHYSLFHKFSTGLVIGSVVSTLFGLWAQFLGGFKVLESWYSNTISSWVPGQTLPLYHQTSEGIVRMQGMGSGPIEFSHGLLLAFWLVNSQQITDKRWLRAAVNVLLLAGIALSGSRAAILGALILLVWFGGKAVKSKFKILNFKFELFDKSLAVNAVLILVMAIAGLSGLKYVVAELPNSYTEKVIRLSDSDHITRPIEAFQIGLKSPIFGNLGELGPAARAYNLKHHNTDQAPIAENVFVDYFAQLGIVGLLLACGFWVSWFWSWSRDYDWLVLGTVMVLLMNLATILDMTPVAISWFAILAFGTTLNTHKKIPE